MIIEEFLIALGVKADTKKLQDFEKGLDGVSDSAEKTEGSMLKAYDATDAFVAGVGKAMGIITFFTGVLGGAINVFHGTIMELEDLIKEEKLLTKVTKDQINQQKKYKESVETMSKRFQSLKVELAFGFLPTMQKTIDSLDNFLKANKDAIINGITVFLNAIKSTLGVIGNFIRFIDKLVTNTVGWKNALLILVGVLAIVKKATIAAFIANPITWIMVAIAGLLLLIDDFMTYLDGGESQFGEFWGGLLKWIEKAKEIWSGFSDTAKGGFKTLAIGFALLMPMLGGFIGTLKTVASVIGLVGKAMAMTPMGRVIVLVGLLVYVIIDLIKWLNGGESQFSALWQAAADVWNKIVDWTSQAIEKMVNAVKKFVDDVGNFFGGVFDAIVNPFKEAFDWVSNKWQGLKNMFGVGVKANVSMGDGVGGRSITTNSNRVVNNNITNKGSFNINGASNPNVTANAVGANWNSITQKNMGGVAKV